MYIYVFLVIINDSSLPGPLFEHDELSCVLDISTFYRRIDDDNSEIVRWPKEEREKSKPLSSPWPTAKFDP